MGYTSYDTVRCAPLPPHTSTHTHTHMHARTHTTLVCAPRFPPLRTLTAPRPRACRARSYVYRDKLPFGTAPPDDRHLPDIHLGLYTEVVVFDHRAILPQFVVEVTLKTGRS